MKSIRILNIIAIAIPFAVAFFAIFEPGIILLAMMATMLTGLLQIIAGICFWVKNPGDNRIKLYFSGVVLFFIGLYFFFESGYNEWIFLAPFPVALCIYLTFIFYNEAPKTE